MNIVIFLLVIIIAFNLILAISCMKLSSNIDSLIINKEMKYGVSYIEYGEKKMKVFKTLEEARGFANFLKNAKEICIFEL